MKRIQCTDIEEFVNRVRALQLKDRLMFDKANRAFVSYIQAYSKHECNLILRVKGTHISYHFPMLSNVHVQLVRSL